MIIITVINKFLVEAMLTTSIFLIFGYVSIYVVGVIVVDLIFAFLVRWVMPQKWFSVENLRFTPSKKTCIFYEKLAIKKWKDKVIELGALTGFRKNKIANPTDNEYIGRFIVEANFGIVVHIACMIFGFLIMIAYFPFAISIALPVAIVNLLLNYLPLMILRYNLPKLRTLYKFNERREKRNVA